MSLYICISFFLNGSEFGSPPAAHHALPPILFSLSVISAVALIVIYIALSIGISVDITVRIFIGIVLSAAISGCTARHLSLIRAGLLITLIFML